MRFEQKKYKLINNDLGTELDFINDPLNWDESERTLKRSTKTYGITTELSKSLEFTKESAKFLRTAYNSKGTEADVKLKEFITHPQNEQIILNSEGDLNFETYIDEVDRIKVSFETGGLGALIKSKLNSKFNLKKTTSIDGKDIGNITPIDVVLTGREILLNSELELTEESPLITVAQSKTVSAVNADVNAIINQKETLGVVAKMNVTSSSDAQNITNVITTNPFFYRTITPVYLIGTEKMFYLISDVAKTVSVRVRSLVETKVNLSNFNAEPVTGEITQTKHVIVRSIFTGGVHNILQTYDLSINQTSQLEGAAIERTHDETISINIGVGESLTLAYYVESKPSKIVLDSFSNAYTYTYQPEVKFKELNIYVSEASKRDDTSCKAYFYESVGKRLTSFLTGKDSLFKSSIYDLNTGLFGKNAITNGFLVRQFTDQEINISLKQFLQSSNVLHGTSYSIEIEEGEEKLVVEPYEYYFRDEVKIKIPEQVSKVKRSVAKEFIFSNLIFGNKKAGEYEEVMGVDEFNVSSEFSTPLKRTDKDFSKKSDIRTDSFAKEFARRKQKFSYPQEDTNYDKELMHLDLKDGLGTAYLERIWQDDFSESPTGIFSPNSATNLRFSPYRLLQRHQFIYNSGLTFHRNENVYFSSSGGNANLSTKLNGEAVSHTEKSDILINDTIVPRFKAEWIEFEFPLDYDLRQLVFGTTLEGGRYIRNYYYKIEFINEYGKKEYGYLFDLKPNKEGKWKLLKAN